MPKHHKGNVNDGTHLFYHPSSFSDFKFVEETGNILDPSATMPFGFTRMIRNLTPLIASDGSYTGVTNGSPDCRIVYSHIKRKVECRDVTADTISSRRAPLPLERSKLLCVDASGGGANHFIIYGGSIIKYDKVVDGLINKILAHDLLATKIYQYCRSPTEHRNRTARIMNLMMVHPAYHNESLDLIMKATIGKTDHLFEVFMMELFV